VIITAILLVELRLDLQMYVADDKFELLLQFVTPIVDSQHSPLVNASLKPSGGTSCFTVLRSIIRTYSLMRLLKHLSISGESRSAIPRRSMIIMSNLRGRVASGAACMQLFALVAGVAPAGKPK
jgi:hypothetical protein